MKILLNYPPASSVWHLPLGVSMLTAVLRSVGHDVIQRYGHIIGLEHVLRTCDGFMFDQALKRIKNPQSEVTELWRANLILEDISSRVQTHDKFEVSQNNVTYVSRYQDGTFRGLFQAIRDREENMWYEYFEKVEIPFVRSFKPQLYGISIADERQLIPGCILAAMIKESISNTLVVMGGNFWSRMQHAFKDSEFKKLFQFVDIIAFKEGFQTMQAIAENGKPSWKVPGIVWMDGGILRVNPISPQPTPFETLPTPSYDGCAQQWSPDIVAPLYTSSNCPTACSFCAIAAGSDTYLQKPRVMSPSRIAEHMIATRLKRFDVVDETFTVARQLALGEELIRRDYAATWQCYLTITNNLLDPHVARQLYRAGCRAVQLGLESMSPETLVREHKTWNTPKNYGRILQNFKEAGIQTHVFIIVGLPGEPLHSTLRWLPFFEEYGDSILTIKPGRYRLTRMSPEVQTSAHRELIEELEDTKPLHLNLDFKYKTASRKRVEAMRDLMEEVCRRHWAYPVTSVIPWWINRGRYTWEELESMSKQLDQAESIPHFQRMLAKTSSIVLDELGIQTSLTSFDDILALAKQI